MKIGIDNALGIHPQAVALRGQRSSILASNIANADTPGYKARDIDFKSIMNAHMQQNQSASKAGAAGRIYTTNEGHIDNQSAHTLTTQLYRVPLMPSLDGNSVDVQLEQTSFAENSLQFQAGLRFLNGRLKGMLTAIKGE